MQHLRLTHPALDFWVDVRVREFDGRWLAGEDLVDTPDIGAGETAQEALAGTLAALGVDLASELAEARWHRDDAGCAPRHLPRRWPR